MNPDELDRMLVRKSETACVEFFAGASEADRKVVAGRALEWYQVSDAFRLKDSPMVKMAGRFGEPVPKQTQKIIDVIKEIESGKRMFPREARDKECLPAARLAVLASAGLTEIRKVGVPEPVHAFAIMRARCPRWLDRWLDFACESQPVGTWDMVRQFELEDMATAERGSGYWLGMALTLGQKEAAQLIDQLRADEELLDTHVWSMLENDEAVRVLSDPSSISGQVLDRRSLFRDFDWQTWPRRGEQWHRASYIWKVVLLELAASDQSVRDKLLEVCFRWIARLSADGESKPSNSFTQPVSPAGWFHAIHDELNLSTSEKEQLLKRYVRLLSTKDPGTLVWTLKNVGECPYGALPVDDLLACLPTVFVNRRKEPAVSALKFLEAVVKEDPSRVAQVGLAALDGFDHTSTDIHKRTLSLLKKTKALNHEAVSAEFRDRLDRIGGMAKKEALELVSQASPLSEGEVPESQADLNGQTEDEESIMIRARQLDASLANVGGVDAAIAAVADGAVLPRCLELASPLIPGWDPQQRLEPVANLDDLVYLFLHILEGRASADDFERALDGVLRLCDLRPGDFPSRVSSLRKKVDELLANMDLPFSQKPYSGVSPLIDLAALARSWIDSKVFQPGIIKPFLEVFGIQVDNPLVPPSPLLFFSERVHSIARLVSKGRALPMLSAPTHRGGWIDPISLPERIAAWKQAGVKLDKADYIQALLRLAPERRDRALALLPQIGDEELCALRWALGDKQIGSVSTAEIWVAAFRCREPRADSKMLKDRFPNLGPDAAERASFKESLEEYAGRSDSIFGTSIGHMSESLPIESVPPLKKRPGIKYFPTELLHDHAVMWDTSDLLELVWPLDRESYFAYQTRRMALYIDSQGTYWQSARNCLFDPDAPTRGLGAWLIALSLSAKQPEVARSALDALIASIDDCRLDGATFGAVMGKLLPTGKITLARWTRALKDVARISAMHTHFVFAALEQCLAQLPADACKSPPIPLLELIYETITTCSASISVEPARRCLQAVEGKGKGAKLAKLLLELPAGKDAHHRKQVALQMLQSRVERVERWQSWLAAGEPAAGKSLV